MDIRNIKKQSDHIYRKNRKQVIPEFFYIGYVSLLAQYLQSGLFSFFVSLFLCPIGHGYVKCSKKLVEEENATLDFHDSLVGMIDFARVAPAYLIRKALTLCAIVLCFIPFLFVGDVHIPASSLEFVSSLGNAFIQTEFFIPYFENFTILGQHISVFIVVVICAMVYLLLTTLWYPVPYIIEEDEYSWSEALQYSVHLMKGHLLSYVQLYLYYFIRHFAYWMITGITLLLVGQLNDILMLFCFVTSLFLYIELFKGRFEVAKYLFYKEIRGNQDEKHFNH